MPTPKQNFRYDEDRWRLCIDKSQEIGTDMTKVLAAACDQFLEETAQQSADRLGTRLARHPQSGTEARAANQRSADDEPVTADA